MFQTILTALQSTEQKINRVLWILWMWLFFGVLGAFLVWWLPSPLSVLLYAGLLVALVYNHRSKTLASWFFNPAFCFSCGVSMTFDFQLLLNILGIKTDQYPVLLNVILCVLPVLVGAATTRIQTAQEPN